MNISSLLKIANIIKQNQAAELENKFLTHCQEKTNLFFVMVNLCN